jgi:hypothetical protein
MALSEQIEGAMRPDIKPIMAATFDDAAVLAPIYPPGSTKLRIAQFMAQKLLDRQRREEHTITMEEFNLFSEMLGLDEAA